MLKRDFLKHDAWILMHLSIYMYIPFFLSFFCLIFENDNFRFHILDMFCTLLFSEEGRDHIDLYIDMFKGAAAKIETVISTNTPHMHPLITGE